MKKVAYTLFTVLLIGLAIYSFSRYDEKTSQAMNLENDIINDYEDIIIKRGNEDEKIVALTFDDGPDKDYTPQVLDILKKHDVKATFFVVGENVTWNPELIKREYEEGHEIGNHTFTHINVAKKAYGEIDKEISQTQEEVKKVIGQEPKLFRPPYRAISKNMCDIIKSKNMNIILWSNLDPRDWSNPGVGYIINTINNKVENGNIILLHDYNRVRVKRSQTIQALEVIIPALKEKGYEFVTVSELINRLENKNSDEKPTQK
ncbi:oligosaccharide deacetylase [Romboutsia weinsteinii]|uniref:Oligosaccharide deacetylase n=1 Tax=Romboutsia weinsteinii TaxID=2020949 RepID=A0A371J0W5_9FIRM|nr:polysaccharide deacetylase family protein [Romboutsia weinsteinii]RDY26334.1 oligosaccharide deacetylase [Romboutsia weinsteinii]